MQLMVPSEVDVLLLPSSRGYYGVAAQLHCASFHQDFGGDWTSAM